jgi:hypothetical protein
MKIGTRFLSVNSPSVTIGAIGGPLAPKREPRTLTYSTAGFLAHSGRAPYCGPVAATRARPARVARASEPVAIGANRIHDGVGDLLPKISGVEARLADRIGDERGFEEHGRHARPGQHVETGAPDA